MTASEYRLPAVGPRDPLVWLTLLAVGTCDRGGIEPDTGRVFVARTDERVKYEIDPAHLDELIAVGWVDDARSHDELGLTDKGRYWLSRFVRMNGGE